MKIKTPVIGIPNSIWKKKAVKFVRNNPNILNIKIDDFCYDCDRHRELLYMFDNNDVNYEKGKYFIYSIKSGRIKEVVLKKINKFKDLYQSIKINGYVFKDDKLPIVTKDGCRLDGSHKLSILEHLGYSETKLNIVIYEKMFSTKKIKKILKDNITYRKEIYNL